MEELLSKRDFLVKGLKDSKHSNIWRSITLEVVRLAEEIKSMGYKTNNQEVMFVTTSEFSNIFSDMKTLNFLHYISNLKGDDILEMLNFLNVCKMEDQYE